MPELVIIIVYFLAMIAVGLWSRRKAREADDFFVAGRKGSALFITGSLVATIIGGSATVGVAGLGYSRGLTGVWWLLVGSIGLVFLGVFLAKKVREYGLYTLPEMVEKLYDRRVASVASILIVIAWLGVIAGQIIAAGQIMSVLGIGSPLLWMLIFTATFVFYTLIGGQYANIRTDLVQAIVIFIGIFGGVTLLVTDLGGLGGLKSSLPPEWFSFPVSTTFGGYDLIALLLLVGLTYVVGPDMYSRIFSARDSKVARISVFWTAGIIIPFSFAVTIMGMGASVLFPQISAEQAFPTLIKEFLPPFIGGLILAALLSAVMSSADSCLLSASTILSIDIVGQFRPSLKREQLLLLARWGIVFLGAGSFVLALTLKGVINALLFAYTIYTAGLIVPILAGFYKNRLKVTPVGALVAIIGGGSTALISRLLDIKYLDLGSLLISALLLFTVSLIENRIRRGGV